MFKTYIGSLIKIGIEKEQIIDNYNITEELYNEIYKDCDFSTIPTEYQKKIMSGEIELDNNINLLEY